MQIYTVQGANPHLSSFDSCVAERAPLVELVKQGTEDLCSNLHTGETAVLIVAMVDVAVSVTAHLPTVKQS